MKKIFIIFTYIFAFLLLLSRISAYTQPCIYAEWHFNGASPCDNATENDPNNVVDCGQGGVHINNPSFTTANFKFDYPAYAVNEAPIKYNHSINVTMSMVRACNFCVTLQFQTSNSTTENKARYYMINRTTYPDSFLAVPQLNNPIGNGNFSLLRNNVSVKVAFSWKGNGTFQGFENGIMKFDVGNFDAGQTDNSRNLNSSWLMGGAEALGANSPVDFWITDVMFINDSCTAPVVLDTTPPEIMYYNVTNENGCETWNTDKNTACSTSSVTPTVQFNTSEEAWCAIAGGSSTTSFNINYTQMTSLRNCTGAGAGEGTKFHRCTAVPEDELVYDTSYLFISCRDDSNNTNRSGTSTSGPLKLSITGLETAGRTSISIGIQNALLSSYTNYTDLQIYARNLSNNQSKGTFDRAAKKGSKMWAFNRIGASETYSNMLNLTPVLYVMEYANMTSTNLTNKTQALIEATR